MDSATLTFVMNAVDNVTPVTEKIAASQDKVIESAAKAQAAIDSQSISFMKQITMVNSLHGGIRMLGTGFHDLGLITDQAYDGINKVNAGVGIMVGSFKLLRTAQEAVNALRDSELGLAAVETFRSVLHNPATVALVGAGLGAAAAIGGMVLTQNNSSQVNVTQNIAYGAGSTNDQRAMSSQLANVGGVIR